MAVVSKILVPLELSQNSKPIAEYASSLAKGLGAKVHILYVAPSANHCGVFLPWTQVEDFVKQFNQDARADFEKFRNAEFAGVDVDYEVTSGYAPDKILEVAEKKDADMIVMGAHGRTDLHYALFGSVAEEILKNATMPVATVQLSMN